MNAKFTRTVAPGMELPSSELVTFPEIVLWAKAAWSPRSNMSERRSVIFLITFVFG
jgi:hypothetical protein